MLNAESAIRCFLVNGAHICIHQHFQGKCEGLRFCLKLAPRKPFLCWMRLQSCAAASSAGRRTGNWVTHLTRSMTRSLGAALTGSSLIITIWSPGISLPSEGPPGHKWEWVWWEDYCRSIDSLRSWSQFTVSKWCYGQKTKSSPTWAFLTSVLFEKELGALDEPEAQATPWPTGSDLGRRDSGINISLKSPRQGWDSEASWRFSHFTGHTRHPGHLVGLQTDSVGWEGTGWDNAFVTSCQGLLMLPVHWPNFEYYDF